METKFRIVETEEYFLAVSDEDASNSCIYFTGDPTGIFRTGIKYKNEAGDYFYQDAITGMSNTYLAEISKKIIGCLPKDNAPGLLHIVKLPSDENVNVQKISRLPLLPEIVVENDIEKLAESYYTQIRLAERTAFKFGYKSATKVYSEEDMRKAYNKGFSEGVIKGTCSMVYKHESFEEYIQFLKQSKTTPKWFVAEMKCGRCYIPLKDDDCWSAKECSRNSKDDLLLTTTINGKTYLVGTYLN
jgi:hypothetical protein